MEVLFETSHIRPVQIIRRQMDILQSGIISLRISDIGVLKNALGFSDSFEQLVAFLIQSTDIRQSFALIGRFLIEHIIEFN
jgi:hypothetical protein